MRNSLLLGAVLLFGLTVSANADSIKDNNPEATPGQQVLMKAELPAKVGDPRHGEDKIDESKTETVDFWFFFPSDDSAKTDAGYPLMLFMHGAGERGDDPEKVKMHGPAKLCADPEIAKTWRFITVSPQCKPDVDWSPLQMMVLIDRICEAYPVDRSRIYVTGLSMGGFGTWGVGAIGAGKIAAIAPICGWYATEKAGLITMPVWAFHGDADPAVNIKSGRAIVNAVKEAGNRDVAFTVYPGVQHDSWTRTYDNPMFYDWLLSKQLPPVISGPKVEPGKQVLMKATLPAKAGGGMFRGEDRLDPERKEDLSFWAFQPSDDSAKTEEGYPLLVFMHGAGERGSNPNLLKRYGPPKLCDNPEIAKTWKFFTVSPQCKENSAWSPLQILAFIDEVCAKYPIDKSRIYVTGVSLGGFGTWGVATIGAGKIAAVAPVCGSYGTDKAAAVTMPVWAFHGEVDPVVKIEGDQAMIDAVKKAGNEDVKFTVYPGVGHDCWNLAYDEKELYEWLLTKSVKK